MTRTDNKYFALMFMARLTHDDLNNAGYADLPVYQLLSKLFSKKLLNNTIIVFFSDHGLRFGPIRQTLSGKLEERLPFMFIYMPKSLSGGKRHENLTINQNRLSTPFDVYATLKHIVDGVCH